MIACSDIIFNLPACQESARFSGKAISGVAYGRSCSGLFISHLSYTSFNLYLWQGLLMSSRAAYPAAQ